MGSPLGQGQEVPAPFLRARELRPRRDCHEATAAPSASPRQLPTPRALVPQTTRALRINQLETITDDVIEAAASILVIGN